MDFMRAPSGAFYTSQDADAGPALHGDVFYARTDAERRAGAQPPIDRNAYARENGWAIASLAALYDVDRRARRCSTRPSAPSTGCWPTPRARTAASATPAPPTTTPISATRSPMAEAALALYRSTAERRYLALADRARRGDRARSSRPDRRLHGAPRPSRARRACWPGR